MKNFVYSSLVSIGFFIVGLFLVNTHFFSLVDNHDGILLISISVVLGLLVARSITPMNSTKRSLQSARWLLFAFAFLSVYDIISILRHPNELKYYGWLLVLLGFTVSFYFIRKELVKKIREEDATPQ
ncbi:hypothetical protein PbJCM13498_12320 [Prolixibacter bellariivorans]|uniref:Uncharacterized protein n=1 Tax=Prolixibacter bellariivorans TaxID=314319 RepID=A0A5M4AWR7_9BACT|nr:hypothetical protein [Prolixibacter bellariivorans]GET32369.1 hypothetical protein PbJCM13498_12320 [Prolixibacter bellariivorans]